MSIVQTNVHVIGSARRIIWYRCLDHLGVWHDYGPVLSSDPAFDAEAHKTIVAEKVATILAESEANAVLG